MCGGSGGWGVGGGGGGGLSMDKRERFAKYLRNLC